jgi:hypothetical protein
VACPGSDCRRRSLPNTVGTHQKRARSVDQTTGCVLKQSCP